MEIFIFNGEPKCATWDVIFILILGLIWKFPVWILELGRWDIKGAIEAGGEVKEMFDKYVDKGIYNILSSVGERDPDNEDDPKEVIGIIDLDGYNFEQLNSIRGKGSFNGS